MLNKSSGNKYPCFISDLTQKIFQYFIIKCEVASVL